jgi:hypothetical protein
MVFNHPHSLHAHACEENVSLHLRLVCKACRSIRAMTFDLDSFQLTTDPSLVCYEAQYLLPGVPTLLLWRALY